MPEAKIAVIGGTGLYEIEGMTDVEAVNVATPFGDPSDTIMIGAVEGTSVAFLPRHGQGHKIAPNELPQRANIYALKSLGIEWIIAINSCGSFKEELKPRDLVVPDQVIDRTKGRVSTFFGNGLVGHIPFAEPFCPNLANVLYEAARESGANVHRGGTFIAMEGPQFSTKAESRLYKSWGADIIGMTIMPEAKLAREAEMCYATLACVTDYHSWHDDLDEVRIEEIIAILNQNMDRAKNIIKLAAASIPEKRSCLCVNALENALITDQERIPDNVKKDLNLLIGKYIS